MAELKQTKQTITNLTTISRERFITKLWRTAVGIGVGAVLLKFELNSTLETWGFVLVGVMVAGEWVLFPLRLLGAACKDVIAPSITAIRQALGK